MVYIYIFSYLYSIYVFYFIYILEHNIVILKLSVTSISSSPVGLLILTIFLLDFTDLVLFPDMIGNFLYLILDIVFKKF